MGASQREPRASQMVTRVKNNVYTLATGADEAELTMYGDICETIPRDYWTGEQIPGSYITLEQFMTDLSSIADKKALTIRLNSYGGDVGVSVTIHNRLRELQRDGMSLSCVVDGVAMSGGSLIMCACDHVAVNAASLVMIHKCWSFVFGEYNADQLRELAESEDAWDKAQINIYKRKTGLSETVLSHMMSETTYMTGTEAVAKGFADEILEDAQPSIAASADGTKIYACGREIRMMPGTKAPIWIPVVKQGVKPEGNPVVDNNTKPGTPGTKGGKSPMTIEELRAQYPEMVAQLEADARAAGVSDASKAERDRLAAIDEIAGLFPAELVAAAKYGDNACTAEQLAYRAAVDNAKKGVTWMNGMLQDNKNSGAQSVTPASPTGSGTSAPKSAEDKLTVARAQIKNLIGGK